MNLVCPQTLVRGAYNRRQESCADYAAVNDQRGVAEPKSLRYFTLGTVAYYMIAPLVWHLDCFKPLYQDCDYRLRSRGAQRNRRSDVLAFRNWTAHGFGQLDAVRTVFFCSLSLFLRIEVIFLSVFLSMLGINRDTYIGE